MSAPAGPQGGCPGAKFGGTPGDSIAALTRLLALASAAPDAAGAPTCALDAAIAILEKRASAGSRSREPIDLQREVVRRFWDTRRLETLRDARLVAFGLDLPASPEGACLFDDKARLDLLLAVADGWLGQPRWYRRCYQGLLFSYFAHDGGAETQTPTARSNWLRLRTYLLARAGATRDPRANPDWVQSVNAHPTLFSDTPCADFTARLLAGDRSELATLSEQLGIPAASWFLCALVRAQVLAATRRDHDGFCALLPTMLALLSGGTAERDTGLAALLERYARIPDAPLHAGLRDALAAAWGAPWQPVDALRWQGIDDVARKLAGDWIKAHLIDVFFAATRDGSGPRRAAFWQRYTASIETLHFATGERVATDTCAPHLPSFTHPLTSPLRDAPADAAIILTIGCARLVVFVDPAEPVSGYDLRKPPPFDVTNALAMAMDTVNSLRHSGRDVCLYHRDGVDGWRHWEQMFSAALNDRFWLRGGSAPIADKTRFVDLSDVGSADAAVAGQSAGPDPAWYRTSPGEDVHWQTAEAASVPYSRPNLEVLARVHGLALVDEASHGGGLSVAGEALDHRIATVLGRWGFVESGRKQWRRTRSESSASFV